MMSKPLKLGGVQDTNNMENRLDHPHNLVEDVVITGLNDSVFQENNEANSSSSSSLNTLSSGENPLQNPVILGHLFQLCPASILTSCRLVCKQWYDESLLIWRTAFSLALTLSRTDEIFLDNSICIRPYLTKSIRVPLEELLEFVSKRENQCETKPYRNFQIHTCVYSHWVEKFSPFWISIGSNLTTLQLFNCKFGSVEQFRRVIYEYCPILQSLQLILCSCRTREAENGLEYKEPIYGQRPHLKSLHVEMASPDYKLPVSWIELFSHFHSLTSFGLDCSDELLESEFENVVAAIKIIRKQDKRKLPLKGFQLPSKLKVSQGQFSVMKELRLPLKKCSIEVHSEIDVDFWISLLEYNAPSMNTITIHWENGVLVQDRLTVPPLFQQFLFGIHLPNLTKFESRGHLIKNFDFLQYMPNLLELKVSGGLYDKETNPVSNACKEELTNVEMRRLMRFKLLNYYVSDEDIQQLSKWMPNVNNLEIALNDRQFGIVCQSWKNLRQLTVSAARQYRMEEIGKGNMEKEVVAKLERLESLSFIDRKLSFEAFFKLFMILPSLQILSDADGPVERCQLRTFSYRKAVEDK